MINQLQYNVILKLKEYYMDSASESARLHFQKCKESVNSYNNGLIVESYVIARQTNDYWKHRNYYADKASQCDRILKHYKNKVK